MPSARHRKEPRLLTEPTGTLLEPVARARTLLPSALLALLVLLVTAPVVRNRFVDLDDRLYLGNSAVAAGLSWAGAAFAFTSVSDLYWHPVTWLSHEIDVSLFGMSPAGHHLTSALFHAVSAGLLFLLLRKLGAGAWSSAVGSLLWALHPLRVESFAWVAERKDVLCALFFLATLLAYLNYAARPSRWGYLAWTALGAMALMSKPSAVCLVPILLLLDYWPLRRTGGFKRWIEKIPLVALSVVVMWLTVYGQKQSGSMSHLAGIPAWVRVENVAVFYTRYIGKMLWPVNLGCFYAYGGPPGPALAIGAALGLLIVTVVAVRMRHRWPWLPVAWCWFLVALLPNIGLLQAGRQSIADRFTNLAMIGVSIGIACSLSGWAGAGQLRKGAVAVSMGTILVVFAFLAVRQIGFWHDSIRLFEHAISVEDSDYIRGNLATTLMSQRRYAEAEPHLALAAQRSPLISDYHSNLANVLLRTGRPDQALGEAAIALKLAPKSIPAVETMGLILFRQGDSRGTLQHFDRAVRLGAPIVPMATELNDMGASLASRGRPQEAEPLVRRALELNPRLVQGWRNLALLLADQNRPEEARAVLQEAVFATGQQAAYDNLAPSSSERATPVPVAAK
jgi:tetratricopeptide (TPR) repeat protein